MYCIWYRNTRGVTEFTPKTEQTTSGGDKAAT
jgi:hypothetical protein